MEFGVGSEPGSVPKTLIRLLIVFKLHGRFRLTIGGAKHRYVQTVWNSTSLKPVVDV